MISIKELITYQYINSRVFTKMYLMLCGSCIYFFSCMLNTLIFTVDNYILKRNQCIPWPFTIGIVYSLVEHDFIISYCKTLIILLYYTAISKEIILFVNQAILR